MKAQTPKVLLVIVVVMDEKKRSNKGVTRKI